MTVVETLGPVSWAMSWRRPSGCSCGQVAVLRPSWTSRWLRRVLRGRMHLLFADQQGRARIITSSLTGSVMEALHGQGPVDPQMERTLLRCFFRDDHIRFVCQKNLFQWVQDQATLYHAACELARQHRCRATFVVSDPYALRLLRCWSLARDPEAAAAMDIVSHPVFLRLGVARNVLDSWLTGIGLLTTVLLRLARQGLVWRQPSRRRFRVALHSHHGVSKRPQDVRFADYLIDGQRIRKQDVLVLLSGMKHDLQRQQDALSLDIERARLFGPPVPLPDLWRLLARLLRAVGEFWISSGVPHPVLRRRAAGAIRYGLMFDVLLSRYAIDVLLSAEESFSHHIVETVVLNHRGGRTAWIPHSVASLNYNMAYLHYDLLPIPGRFPVGLHGATWSRRMIVTPVGLLWNDGRPPAETASASESVRAIIDEARRGGRKIVAAFTGSYSNPDEFLMERNQRFLTVLARLAEHEPQLLILIKPKADAAGTRHVAFLFHPPLREILEPEIRQGTIRILDPRDGFICAAQDLIAASDAVVSTSQYSAFNSVWVEALLLGKPSYSFTPSEFRRNLSAPWLFDEWLFDDQDALVGRLRASLQEVQARPPLPERVTSLFDPYNDGRAMERFREAILTVNGNGRVPAPAGAV